MSKRIIPKQYLGAFKQGHRKSAREFIDDELAYYLLDKTKHGCEKSKKALEWLTQFNNEFYKAVIKRGDSNAFHKTTEEIAACDLRNRASGRDIFPRLNKSKKQGDGF